VISEPSRASEINVSSLPYIIEKTKRISSQNLSKGKNRSRQSEPHWLEARHSISIGPCASQQQKMNGRTFMCDRRNFQNFTGLDAWAFDACRSAKIYVSVFTLYHNTLRALAGDQASRVWQNRGPWGSFRARLFRRRSSDKEFAHTYFLGGRSSLTSALRKLFFARILEDGTNRRAFQRKTLFPLD